MLVKKSYFKIKNIRVPFDKLLKKDYCFYSLNSILFTEKRRFLSKIIFFNYYIQFSFFNPVFYMPLPYPKIRIK